MRTKVSTDQGNMKFIIYLPLIYLSTMTSVRNESKLSSNEKSPFSTTCDIIWSLSIVSVNCFNQNMQFVPSLPKDSTIIRLDCNNISQIMDQPFLGMNTLRSLNLSNNPLERISNELFKGLLNLESLFMTKTNLYYNYYIDYKKLFSDLLGLYFIPITMEGEKYSDCHDYRKVSTLFTNIDVLKRFQSIEIDTPIFFQLCGKHQNDIVSKVLKLKLLNLNRFCAARTFHNSYSNFLSFPALEDLDIITNSVIKHLKFEIDTFSHLKHLHILSIRSIPFLPCPVSLGNLSHIDKTWTIDNVLYNITASVSKLEHLRELASECMHCPTTYWNLNCSLSLNELKNIDTLEKLSLKRNSLRLRDCFRGPMYLRLPKYLRHLDLTHNCLWIDDALIGLACGYSSLEVLDMRYQNWCGVPIQSNTKSILNADQSQPTNLGQYSLLESQLVFQKDSSIYKNINLDLREFYFSHHLKPYHYWFSSPCEDHQYPNLTKLELSWLVDFKGYSLSVPSNFLRNRHNIEYIDISGSKISHISPKAFHNASKLKTLLLSSNALGEMGSNFSEVIKHISTLAHLDLSENGLKSLNTHIFDNMKGLEILDLSHNKLSGFDISTSPLVNLKLLNISHNKLEFLSSGTIQTLKNVRKVGNFMLDIRGNPLLCNCKTIYFIEWLKFTQTRIYKKQSLFCISTSGNKIAYRNFGHEINRLSVDCISHKLIKIFISVSLAFCLAVIICLHIYRYRIYKWRLRYLYHMAKLRPKTIATNYDMIFDYDAFISYSSDDYEVVRTGCIKHLEHAKGLKLFIHERDFTPGEAIAYNISVGIHSSKLTVFFISEAFLKSEWCLYEFNMARMESLYAKRTVFLIVILESSVISKLPIDMLDVIRFVTYLEYPEYVDEADKTVFWSKLADCILEC